MLQQLSRSESIKKVFILSMFFREIQTASKGNIHKLYIYKLV